MNIRSIKQFAEEQNVSYEAIRKQIVRYSDELKDHIIRRNRTQYLDDWAVEFLKEKRKENPIILMNMDQNEQIEELKAQVDLLKVQLMTAQNELLKEKERVITLQDESKKLIEDRGRYTALLEDSKAKEEKLTDLSRTIEEKDDQIRTIQKEADDLRKERDEAQSEARSYKKSIFGFYRKV